MQAEGARAARAAHALDQGVPRLQAQLRAPQRRHGHIHHLQELQLPDAGRARAHRRLPRARAGHVVQAQRLHDAHTRRPGACAQLSQQLHRPGQLIRRHLAARHCRAHLQGVSRAAGRASALHTLRLRAPQLVQLGGQVRGGRHAHHAVVGADGGARRRHLLHRPHRQGERQQRQAHRARQDHTAEGGARARESPPGARHGHIARAQLARLRGAPQNDPSVPRPGHVAHHQRDVPRLQEGARQDQQRQRPRGHGQVPAAARARPPSALPQVSRRGREHTARRHRLPQRHERDGRQRRAHIRARDHAQARQPEGARAPEAPRSVRLHQVAEDHARHSVDTRRVLQHHRGHTEPAHAHTPVARRLAHCRRRAQARRRTQRIGRQWQHGRGRRAHLALQLVAEQRPARHRRRHVRHAVGVHRRRLVKRQRQGCQRFGQAADLPRLPVAGQLLHRHGVGAHAHQAGAQVRQAHGGQRAQAESLRRRGHVHHGVHTALRQGGRSRQEAHQRGRHRLDHALPEDTRRAHAHHHWRLRRSVAARARHPARRPPGRSRRCQEDQQE